MISIKHKFLFIHIPKTGGNSIQNILREYSEDKIVKLSDFQDGIERFEVRNEKYNIVKHSTLNHYKNILEHDLYKELYKFSTIRNPWDMMISFYFSPHRGGVKWDKNEFKELLINTKTWKDYIATESITEKINRKIGFNFLPVKDRALDSEINYLMTFENIENDFKYVCDKIGIPYKSLPHRNKSKRKHYSHYYDDELIELVREKFKEEIKFGDYTFESK